MRSYEYKLDGTKQQYAAIDEAMRIVQFIRNKCVRMWMETRGSSSNDLQRYCAVLIEPHWTSQDCSVCRTRVKKSLSLRTHICPSCGLVLDRDENAARNIVVKALEGTLGHRETYEQVSCNAWGEATATVLSERATWQVASRNQEPPAL